MSDAVIVERGHGFSEQQLERALDGLSYWREVPERVFDIDASVQLALEHQRHTYEVSNEWISCGGLLSREEALFWFSLFSNPEFLAADSWENEVDEPWIREHSQAFGVDYEVEDLFDAVRASGSFAVSRSTGQPLARLLRALAPYDRVIAFLGAELTELTTLADWVESLGPPPGGADELLMEQVASLFDERDSSEMYPSGAVLGMLNMFPHAPAIEAALGYGFAQGWGWSAEFSRVLFLLRDEERIFDLLDEVDPEQWTRMSAEYVMLFVARFGVDERLERFLDHLFGLRKDKHFRDAFDAVLQVYSPEVMVHLYKYLRQKDKVSAIEAYAARGDSSAIEGLLRLCHARSKKRDWAMTALRGIVKQDPARAEQVVAMARALHPKKIIKLIEGEFGATRG